MGDRKYDVIVWGATGFTAKLLCAMLVRTYGYSGKYIRYSIAGRDEVRLQEVQLMMRNEYMSTHTGNKVSENEYKDVDIMICDVNKIEKVKEMCAQCVCMCALAGPYHSAMGESILKSCIDTHTHYVDITGEFMWVKEMKEKYDSVCVSNKVKIIPCCGYDFVPTDVSLSLTHEFVKEHHQGKPLTNAHQVLHHVKAGVSGGTLRSMFQMLSDTPLKKLREIKNDPYVMCTKKLQGKGEQNDQGFISWNRVAGCWTAPHVMGPAMSRYARWSNEVMNYPYSEDFTIKISEQSSFLSCILLTLMTLCTGLAIPIIKLFSKWLTPCLPASGNASMTQETMESQEVKLDTYTTVDDKVVKFTMHYPDGEMYMLTAFTALEAAITCVKETDLPSTCGVISPTAALGPAYVRRLKRRIALNVEYVKM